MNDYVGKAIINLKLANLILAPMGLETRSGVDNKITHIGIFEIGSIHSHCKGKYLLKEQQIKLYNRGDC